jgi:hypothetical protein
LEGHEVQQLESLYCTVYSRHNSMFPHNKVHLSKKVNKAVSLRCCEYRQTIQSRKGANGVTVPGVESSTSKKNKRKSHEQAKKDGKKSKNDAEKRKMFPLRRGSVYRRQYAVKSQYRRHEKVKAGEVSVYLKAFS